jgi:dTDP-4-amino-4,6-dideoxygalactose transaminase
MRTKTRVDDLAIFGEPSLFADPVHVGAPNVGDAERVTAMITDALDRRWLTNDGPYVRQFERHVADLVGAEYAVATCNATIALALVAAALGLRGEVIVPSLTFVATAHALAWQGLTPVFCDVDPETWTLDPRRVEDLIGPDTAAILGVHLWGRPCDVVSLTDVADRHRVHLFFDAAHALGCTYGGRPLGSFGDAEIFSFHATKVCNAFEGGVVATNDRELAATVATMRNFGFVDVDQIATLGINAKLPEASAAMGIVSLESLGNFVHANEAHHRRYRDAFEAVPGLRLRVPDPDERHNYHYVVAEVGAGAGVDRDQLWSVLWAENVLARRYFYPGCHRMAPYCSTAPEAGDRLPVTEAILDRVLCLPTGTAVDAATVDRICELITFIFANGDEISDRLDARTPRGGNERG